MIVFEAIEKVKERKPNAYDDHTLLEWLNEIEARVQRELMDTAPEGIFTYSIEQDMERELLLPKPYDVVYLHYVIAMIEFNQHEYEAYNNTVDLANSVFLDAQKYYNQVYGPRKRLKVKNWL
jgi:hypothetical protein